MRFKLLGSLMATFILAILSICKAYAMSDGIRENRENECAIYLCLPSGFGQGCSAAKSAYIGRITDFTGGHHPQRKYTDLPRFDYCLDQPSQDTQQVIDDLGIKDSNITYHTAYDITVPQHNPECTRWADKQVYSNEKEGYELVRYCAAVRTVYEQSFESDNPNYYYETIDVGDLDFTKLKAKSQSFIEVLVDGKRVGDKYHN